MDCEKFESTLIDELYDELDELTSAAAKRHVAGCARCAALLGGLKATRRVAVLPTIEPPADLEDRILAAARDAQKVVPLGLRFSHAISWAGSWAMKPQTAMAALFLLMIGTGVLLTKGRATHSVSAGAVRVSGEGAPAPAAANYERAEADLEAPRAADASAAAAPAPLVSPETNAPAGGGGGFPALNRHAARSSEGASAKAGAPRAAPNSLAADDLEIGSGGGMAGNSTSSAFAAHQPSAAQAAGAPAPPPAAPAAMARAADIAPSKSSSTDFDEAMNQYRAGNYREATRLFDSVAASGNNEAALYAARSVEADGGCSAAIGRFDQLATRAFGTGPGYDATLAAGHCYRTLGDADRARRTLVKLLTVTTHAQRAKDELGALAPSPPAGAAKPTMPNKPAAY